MRGLEARLGLRLLTRTTRSVAPTEAGERLLETLAPALRRYRRRLAALSELRDKPAGTIRITTGEHAAETILWPALARLLPRLPGHQGRDRRRLRPDRHRRRALRRRRAPRRAGRQGHDRRADRPGPAHGGGRLAGLLRRARHGPQTPARSRRPRLHQPAAADLRRALCLGVREGRARAQRAGRGPAGVQHAAH